MAEIEEFLKVRAREGLLRTLKPVSLRKEGRVCFNKKEYLDFSSNDYLGLSSHPKLIAAAKRATDKFGVGLCASRLMSGDLELHHKLEREIAEFKNKEASLFFNSGYQANLGIISSLYGKGDCIFFDRLSHASIIDGVVLSGAEFFRFHHNDVEHLESMLRSKRAKFNKSLIITETVFSMDGDKAPLKDLVKLKDKYHCEIFVDEAHATGIFGKQGSGMVEQEGLDKKIDFIMGTFSKALGGFGAYVATSKIIVDYLVNTCRSFIYSTALPPAVIACNLAGLQVIKEEPFRREKIIGLSQYFRSALKSRGFEVRGESQIIPVVIGENIKTKRFAKKLQDKGYWVLPIRPPAVPKGESRLRFSLTFYHDKETLERLIDEISGIRV